MINQISIEEALVQEVIDCPNADVLHLLNQEVVLHSGAVRAQVIFDVLRCGGPLKECLEDSSFTV